MSQVQTTEVPEYRVLNRTFIEPHTLEPGTRIRYNGMPGTHLQPLNAAAEARMEEFYKEQFPERDPRTKQLTGDMIAPREVLRFKKPEENVHHAVTITAMPAEDPMALKVQSLGEIMATRKPTDQRPGPAPVPMHTVEVKTPEEAKNG